MVAFASISLGSLCEDWSNVQAYSLLRSSLSLVRDDGKRPHNSTLIPRRTSYGSAKRTQIAARKIAHESANIVNAVKKPRYRREDRAMPLYISIRIEFYNGVARFLCHSTAFLYSPTSATVQMLKLHAER